MDDTSMQTLRITLPAEATGKRLDAALAPFFPELGLRGRRRLWLHRRVMVDGRERGPAHKVSGGESVTFISLEHCDFEKNVPARENAESTQLAPDIRLVGRSAEYAALFKPAGLHTAALAGDPTPSLEGLLPRLWEDFRRLDPSLPPTAPVLLSRLDAPTSGLIAAAFGPRAAEAFRRLEAAGMVRKRYLALVHGHLDAPLALTRALDTADRKKTRVAPETTPDATRHTLVEPIRPVDCPAGEAILVRATIQRGARHQIRAHLAAAGHPLVGDVLYGGPGLPEHFFLRHYRLELPDRTFELEEHDHT